ncbi:MAG: exodeoxyribonuclease VII large subunit [Firmicutes bacterium ADurb.Bin356]|nr:MAG: exodeoxyribonuclease VII large subunit [Firmicutes bacterium ADurb.Bin356]
MLMHARGLSIVGYSLNENKRSLDNSMQKLHHAVLTQLKMHHANLDSLLKRHTALSLSSILDRGFALIYDENGKLLSSVSGLINEMEVKIQMRDGYAAVRIKHNNCLKRSTNETD